MRLTRFLSNLKFMYIGVFIDVDLYVYKSKHASFSFFHRIFKVLRLGIGRIYGLRRSPQKYDMNALHATI